jgi:polar amino acid transport system substrate-binding protein
MQRTRIRRTGVIAAAVLAVSCAAAGCSSSGSATSTPHGTPSATGNSGPTIPVDPALHASLPSRFRQSGAIYVATNPTYAPNEFYAPDNKTMIGMDIDLGHALAQLLGVKFQFVAANFDTIIPGLQSGQYNMGLTSMTITPARNKVVDFVSYFQAGESLLVTHGNPLGLHPADLTLCGRRIAVEKGTIFDSTDIPNRSKQCTAAGKKTIDMSVYTNQNQAELAVVSGRADATIGDTPVMQYAANLSHGQLGVSGPAYGVAPYGMPVPTDDGALAHVLRAALVKLMASGTYAAILRKWGVQSGAITTPKVLLATG